jgi:hypothetical protein
MGGSIVAFIIKKFTFTTKVRGRSMGHLRTELDSISFCSETKFIFKRKGKLLMEDTHYSLKKNIHFFWPYIHTSARTKIIVLNER